MVSRKDLNQEYRKIMTHTRSQLDAYERIMSKIIHNDILSNILHVFGQVIMRPRAILIASIFSLVVSASVYCVSYYFGYSTNSNTPLLMLLPGWLLGIAIDYLIVLLESAR